MSRKVTNPLTGHKIQVGGGTYNSLVRQGVISQRGGFGCKKEKKEILNLYKSYVYNTEIMIQASYKLNPSFVSTTINLAKWGLKEIKEDLIKNTGIKESELITIEDSIRARLISSSNFQRLFLL